jgi:hypothetical protein
LGCNNGGVWTDTAVLSCDWGMGELPKRAANPGGLETIFRDAVPMGRKQVMTMPKEANETFADVGLTRFTFATAYVTPPLPHLSVRKGALWKFTQFSRSFVSFTVEKSNYTKAS